MVDPTWLENLGYSLVKPGGRQNLVYWCKTWKFPRTQIHHSVYKNGTSILLVTPHEPQSLQKFDMCQVADVLQTAFRNTPSYNPKILSIERSRVESGELLAWFSNNNIKELKVYRKDRASLRVEVTYLSPALSPFTSQLLYGWSGESSETITGGMVMR